MKPIFKLCLFLGLLASVRLGLAASPATSSAACSFRAMSWDDEITDLKIAIDDKKSTSLALRPNGRSEFYRYEGPKDQPLVFFRESKHDKGETVRTPAATVPLNTLYEHSLLMFSSLPDRPGQYAVLAMDDSPKALAPGGYCFMNFSKAPLAIKCGMASGIVPAGKSLVLAGKSAEEGEITGVEIYAQEAGSAPKRVYANRWPYDDKTRTTVFVFQIPGEGSFELKRIHEDVTIMANHVKAAAAAAAAAAKKAAAAGEAPAP